MASFAFHPLMGTMVQASRSSAPLSPSMLDVIDAVQQQQALPSQQPLLCQQSSSVDIPTSTAHPHLHCRDLNSDDSDSDYDLDHHHHHRHSYLYTSSPIDGSCTCSELSTAVDSYPLQQQLQQHKFMQMRLRAAPDAPPALRRSSSSTTTTTSICSSISTNPNNNSDIYRSPISLCSSPKQVRFNESITDIDSDMVPPAASRRASYLDVSASSPTSPASTASTTQSQSSIAASMASFQVSLASLAKPAWLKHLLTRVHSRRNSTSTVDEVV
ncbi:hypothetical protein BSLG_010476 [Batrachochytrium salamandrivorans]|nr:hypothetical protein BSLG_010476 [Batrachochytrium salamandrivorans]